MYKVVVNNAKQTILDNNGNGYSRSDAVLLANEIRRFDKVSVSVLPMNDAKGETT